jgi:phosphatidate cytidylyltransferase
MVRILSAIVILPIIVGIIWLLPAMATLVLAEVVALVAFFEFRGLAERVGSHVPPAVTAIGVLATCAATGWPNASVDGPLMVSTVAILATVVGSRPGGEQTLHDASAAIFALVYLGLPLGALAAIRTEFGAPRLLLLLATIMISDTAQFYGGRLLGRRPLAPALSPKKTVEGAIAGFVAGALGMVAIGLHWLPGVGASMLALLGATLVALGISGDLFESALKRSAGVKDASGLIPGHGGVLDRLDGLLFAGPVFYVYLRYVV